jgi:hypothetical protein
MTMKYEYVAACLATTAWMFTAGCDGGEETTPPEEIKPLTAEAVSVRAVDWNPSMADVGDVAAVTEIGSTAAVLGSSGATVFSGGVVIATDAAVDDWVSAAVIPAADGHGQWISGLTESGNIYRLRGQMMFEKVSDLYGLSDVDVLAMASLGGTGAVFALEGQLAVSDGNTVTRYDVETFTGLAGRTGRAVSASDGKVRVFVAATEEGYDYELEGAEQAVFNAAGRIVVRTADSIYIEAEDGTLALLYKGSKGPLRELASSDVRVWFIEGEELGALEADAVYVTEDAKIPEGSRLRGSTSGDVWMLDKGDLSRYAAETGDDADRKVWEEEIQPLYMSSCTPCHSPGGSAGIELSSYGAWVARRDIIRTNVVEKKTMPPEGISFSDEDRKVIASWTGE